MPSFSVASTTENKINTLNKKIVEIKKKIQLSEGQRKANFEECDVAKHENAVKIINLKKEVKELYIEYAKARNNEEAAERAALLSRDSFACVKKRSLEDTITKVDEENIRLKKKLDIMKYRREKEEEKLHKLLQERHELKSGKTQKKFKKKMEVPLRKKIIRLEIQLERMRMMHTKANAVRKRYKSICSNLKSKAVHYASSLKELEDSIKEQENEIDRLKGIKEEAIELKNKTQEALAKQEIEEINSSKDRECVIQDYRRRVAERKAELERLERMIFSGRPRDDFDSREEKRQDGTEDITKDELMRLEEAFAKLRNATGVSRSEDVLNRFLGQRATKESVQKMRTSAEHQKMLLEKKRQELTEEIEMQKFSEAKNSECNAEEIEKLNKSIEEQRSRQEKAEAEIKRIRNIVDEITDTIWRMYVTLYDIRDTDILEERSKMEDPVQLIELLEDKIKHTIQILGGPDKYMQTLNGDFTDKMETMSIATTSAEGKATRSGGGSLFPRFPTSPTPAQLPSEDEEEVPTRNALKRQAQLLVDTKSRRKGFAFRR